MATHFSLEYVGFTAGDLAREYNFIVRSLSGELGEYIVSIGNEAFVSRRARYQDGPDICSIRLHRELTSSADSSPAGRLCVTDSDLLDYHESHAPKSAKRLPLPKNEV